jgi:hypothetical protein
MAGGKRLNRRNEQEGNMHDEAWKNCLSDWSSLTWEYWCLWWTIDGLLMFS